MLYLLSSSKNFLLQGIGYSIKQVANNILPDERKNKMKFKNSRPPQHKTPLTFSVAKLSVSPEIRGI